MHSKPRLLSPLLTYYHCSISFHSIIFRSHHRIGRVLQDTSGNIWELPKQNFYRPGAILTATSTKHCFYLTASFPVAALHFAQPTVPKDWYLVMYKSKWVFCDATNSTRQSTSISEVILQNVKDSCHLWEDEDFVSKWSQVCQQLINNDQLVTGRHQVFT